MTTSLRCLFLPAYDELADLPSEAEPQRDRLGPTRPVDIEGLDRPVRCTDDGVGIVPTGVGKVAAATTTAAIAGSERIDLSRAMIVSAGIAGGPPESTTIGSLVVASSLVDWDAKLRRDDSHPEPIEPNPYSGRNALVDLDGDLVETVVAAIDDEALTAATARAGSDIGIDVSAPSIAVGTNLCGDELFHGHSVASSANALVEAHGRGPYLATEMEDIGTAIALRQFGLLDRYVSLRAIANYDRPGAGTDSLDESSLAEGTPVAIASLTVAVDGILATVLDDPARST